jgi:hypothetical protein
MSLAVMKLRYNGIKHYSSTNNGELFIKIFNSNDLDQKHDMLTNPYYLFNDVILSNYFDYRPIDIYKIDNTNKYREIMEQLLEISSTNVKVNVLFDCHGCYGIGDETYLIQDDNRVLPAKVIFQQFGKVLKNPIKVFSKVCYDRLTKHIDLLPKGSLIISSMDNDIVSLVDYLNEAYFNTDLIHYLFKEGFDPIKILIMLTFDKCSVPYNLPVIQRSNCIPVNIDLLNKHNIRTLADTTIVRNLIKYNLVKPTILNNLESYLDKGLKSFPCTYLSFMNDLSTIGIPGILNKYQPYFPNKPVAVNLTNQTLERLRMVYEDTYVDFNINPFYELSSDKLNHNHEMTPYIAYLHALAIIKNERIN